MSFLNVSGLTGSEGSTVIVSDVSFTQDRFQRIAISGETGSGKTSLLKMMSGHLQPDAGTTSFKGERVLGPLEKLLPGHPGIAYLSQHFELRNNFFVHEILEYANELTPEKTQLLYAICRIDHLLSRRTDQLSGGERQRVALARLLSGSPELLLLDEPFSNLDPVHKAIIKSVIRDIGEQLKITCILVSHEAPDVLSWADKILVMRQGQVIQAGTPYDVYFQPLDEYVAGLFGEYNLVDDPAIANCPPGKKAMIRPEQLSISETGTSLEGSVQKSIFWGGYHTVDVWIGSNLLRVRSAYGNYAEGETLFLNVPDKPWFI